MKIKKKKIKNGHISKEMTKILIKSCNWIMPCATVNLLGILKSWKREQLYLEKRSILL